MSSNNAVICLQEDAVSPDTDIATLVRTAYLIARKLELKDFENWISNELNGYNSADEVPDYRHVGGEPKFWNPYNSWCPLLFENLAVTRLLSNYPAWESIPNLQSVVLSGGQIYFTYPPEISAYVNTELPFQTKHALFINRNRIQSILETVRNHVLDWAITLESNGIVGENLIFTQSEKETAAREAAIIQYVNNFYSSTSGTQIQQGGSDNEQ